MGGCPCWTGPCQVPWRASQAGGTGSPWPGRITGAGLVARGHGVGSESDGGREGTGRPGHRLQAAPGSRSGGLALATAGRRLALDRLDLGRGCLPRLGEPEAHDPLAERLGVEGPGLGQVQAVVGKEPPTVHQP